jgi:hypothetical protein
MKKILIYVDLLPYIPMNTIVPMLIHIVLAKASKMSNYHTSMTILYSNIHSLSILSILLLLVIPHNLLLSISMFLLSLLLSLLLCSISVPLSILSFYYYSISLPSMAILLVSNTFSFFLSVFYSLNYLLSIVTYIICP